MSRDPLEVQSRSTFPGLDWLAWLVASAAVHRKRIPSIIEKAQSRKEGKSARDAADERRDRQEENGE